MPPSQGLVGIKVRDARGRVTTSTYQPEVADRCGTNPTMRVAFSGRPAPRDAALAMAGSRLAADWRVAEK